MKGIQGTTYVSYNKFEDKYIVSKRVKGIQKFIKVGLCIFIA